MSKGIVMQMSERFAIVMTRDGRFVKVKSNPAYQIGEEIAIPQTIWPTGTKWIVSAAAAILLCIIALSALSGALRFGGQTMTAVAYVSIDINPSVELGLNRRSIVVEANGLNEAGQQLLQETDVIGRHVEAATAELIKQAGPYIVQYMANGFGEILIASTFMDEDGAMDEELLKQNLLTIIDRTIMELYADGSDVATDGTNVNIEEGGNRSDALPDDLVRNPDKEETKEQKPVRITAITVPNDVRNDAKEKGISAGKLAVGLIISGKTGHSISLDDVGGQSISQLAEQFGGLEVLMSVDHEALRSEIEQLFAQSRKGKSDIGLENVTEKQSSRETWVDQRRQERWNFGRDHKGKDHNDRGHNRREGGAGDGVDRDEPGKGRVGRNDERRNSEHGERGKSGVRNKHGERGKPGERSDRSERGSSDKRTSGDHKDKGASSEQGGGRGADKRTDKHHDRGNPGKDQAKGKTSGDRAERGGADKDNTGRKHGGRANEDRRNVDRDDAGRTDRGADKDHKPRGSADRGNNSGEQTGKRDADKKRGERADDEKRKSEQGNRGNSGGPTSASVKPGKGEGGDHSSDRGLNRKTDRDEDRRHDAPRKGEQRNDERNKERKSERP